MRLFVDNCLAPRHARALHLLSADDGHEIVHLRDKFPESTGDDVWIPALDAEGGWCAITKDRNIRRKPHERRLWMGRSLVMFFLAPGWDHLRLGVQHAKLSSCMDELFEQARRARPGTGFILRVDGRVTRAFVGPPPRGG